MTKRSWIAVACIALIVGLEIPIIPVIKENIPVGESLAPDVQGCPSPAQLGFTTEKPLIKVPQDFPTIQAAIDAAPEGAKILIAPGTYQESLIIHKSIHLQGVSRDHVIIKSTEPSRATIMIIRASVWIENLAVTESVRQMGRVELIGVSNTLIQQSAFHMTRLYTVALAGEDQKISSIALCSNLFQNGEVIVVPGASQFVGIIGNTLRDTNIQVRYSQWEIPPEQVGVKFLTPRVFIEKNIIQGNSILLYKAQGVRIRENIIEGLAESGMEINASDTLIQDNLIRNNKNGIWISTGRAILKRNRIEGNGLKDPVVTAFTAGVHISGVHQVEVELEENHIVGNVGWGILITNIASITVCRSNRVAENHVGDYGWYWFSPPLTQPQPSPALKQKCEGS
jgi:hypothetical protein